MTYTWFSKTSVLFTFHLVCVLSQSFFITRWAVSPLENVCMCKWRRCGFPTHISHIVNMMDSLHGGCEPFHIFSMSPVARSQKCSICIFLSSKGHDLCMGWCQKGYDDSECFIFIMSYILELAVDKVDAFILPLHIDDVYFQFLA